ncbi:MAG: nucleotidyltransferase domain-containing protein [Candidatus Thorarchaeota archaeon]|nr:nucleotidyltransferase domain-containing protein [Candidatus Thorarchaeota archaeon]
MNINEQMEEIVTKIRNHLGEQLDFIVLFGSEATGHSHPLSDIDIGVRVSNPTKGLHDTFANLLSLFDYTDSSSFPRIDVTLLNLASLTLLYRVVRDGKILYAKDDEVWSCFVEYVLGRYPDWEYYIENYLRQSLGA